jgi:hypothetical protein
VNPFCNLQSNGQKKKYKKINNDDLQNIHLKLSHNDNQVKIDLKAIFASTPTTQRVFTYSLDKAVYCCSIVQEEYLMITSQITENL